MTKMYTRNRPAGEVKGWVKRPDGQRCTTRHRMRDKLARPGSKGNCRDHRGVSGRQWRTQAPTSPRGPQHAKFGRTRPTLNYRTWTCLIGPCHASSETAASQIKPILT